MFFQDKSHVFLYEIDLGEEFAVFDGHLSCFGSGVDVKYEDFQKVYNSPFIICA
jgi:hypothetical protein